MTGWVRGHRLDRRFIVVDLGTQLDGDGERRFAVWDRTVTRFWKINNHQTWARIDELVADFAVFPDFHRTQHDDITEQAFALGFPTSSEEPA